MSTGSARFAILCIAAGLVAGGCSKIPVSAVGNKPPVFGASDSVFTDQQLRAAAYSLYAGPAGFYSEQHPATYAAPLYMSTLSVAPCDSRPGQWVELSTDDSTQARAWADASVACASDSFIVDAGPPTVNQRYIEFVTYRPGEGPRHPLRVHRASYLDRSGFDRFHPGRFIGVLVLRPVDNAAARGVAEYLWYVDHPYAWPDTRVLTSFSRASAGSVLHTVYFVRRTIGIGLFGSYPIVALLRDDFRVDIANGTITFGETYLREIVTR